MLKDTPEKDKTLDVIYVHIPKPKNVAARS